MRRGVAARLTAAVFVAALVAVGRGGVARAGDPRQVWRTVETAHFVVNYHEPLGALADKVARAAERAHATLAPAMRRAPRERTQIVLTDETDGANGFANAVPRNEIHLYASAPSDLSALSDHDDWLFALVAHEYTHVLHLDSIAGLPALYNRVFGKTWSPNQLLPRWMIEGLATYEESRRTAGGRRRHALFETFVRMATLRRWEWPLDVLSSSTRPFPHGNAAYLYGSHFLGYVFDRFGDDRVATMSWAYGSNPIPYGLSRSLVAATGLGVERLYADWGRHRLARYGLQAEAIARGGRHEGRRLTFTGEGNAQPRYSRDGRFLLWDRGDGASEPQFRAMPVDGRPGESRTYAVIQRAGAYDVLSDGSLVVEQTHTHRAVYDFQELIRWERATGRAVPLTDGARASDPAVSPDERWVAFARNGAARRRLALMPLAPGAPIRTLWQGGPYDQAFTPAWSSDGAAIAFSAWRQGGYRDILVVDVASGRVRELTRDRAQDVTPTFSRDGRFVLFSSDRGGVYDVYAFELATGALWQVTEVLGCALQPAVSPDGRRLAYQGFGEDGYEIFELALDPARFVRAPLYVDDRPDPIELRADEVAVSAPRPYRALETLGPERYAASLRQDAFGRALSLATDGGDVAGHHAYDLATTISLDQTNVDVGGSYSYRRLWPSVRVSASRTATRRGGFLVDGRSTAYREELLSSTTSIGLPVLRAPERSATISLDYDLDFARPLDAELPGFDPNQTVPRVPAARRLAGLAVRATYGDSRGYAFTVGPQTGTDLALSARVDHAAVGSQREALTLSYRVAAYRQVPLPTPATVAVRWTGGLRVADAAARFGLGGVAPQDVVGALRDDARAASSGYLRGYPARSVQGTQFHLINLEWRQELFALERGLATLPIYLRRLHYAALVDAGDAFDGDPDLARVRTAVGGALRLDFVLGYFLPATLDVGYARGLGEGGDGESWLLLTGTL